VYEIHKSSWKKKDFKKISYTYFISDSQSYIVLLSKNKNIKKIIRKHKIKNIKLFFSNFPIIVRLYRLLFK